MRQNTLEFFGVGKPLRVDAVPIGASSSIECKNGTRSQSNHDAATPLHVDTASVPGMQLLSHFITKDEHSALVNFVDKQTWSTQLSRRVQQYGFAYDYTHPLQRPAPTVAIPTEFAFLVRRLVERGLFDRTPDQVIVNEYNPGQGIAPHVDQTKHFGGTVASLSMISPCVMVMRPVPEAIAASFSAKDKGKTESKASEGTQNSTGTSSATSFVPLLLEPRSLLVLSGDSRYKWTHGIERRKTDTLPTNGAKAIKRGRRISLTFRTMCGDACRSPLAP